MAALIDLHAKFVHGLDDGKESIEKWAMQHLRVSGIYWGMGAMHVMNRLGELPRDQIVAFALACQNADGGFGGNANHDSHLLYTLSAVQVLCMFGAEQEMRVDAVCEWVAALQQPNGAFAGDKWLEVDTRFSYCALNLLSLLGQLRRVDVDKAADFVLECENWDGGFGVSPHAESHSGQVFCCVGALRIANALHRLDADRLGWWLAERQVPSGGLNGRPEKKADVCYSWWVLSSLSMIERLDWIDRDGLFRYVLECQDAEDGGIADKPGNTPDVYHTFFGVAGLALLGYDAAALNAINPVYAMPPEVLLRLGVPAERGGATA
jgi:geranylgeranyl transferase type-2 subunit beta